MKLTAKQLLAEMILAGVATYIMLFGGSRSGKTFLIVRSIIIRAIKAPFSRHVILRFRFSHVKQSIMLDTFPRVMSKCFPDMAYKLDKSDYFATLLNGSEIWFGGLDDKERTEKILGKEYVTIFLNESSQISWNAVGLVITRLAQKVMQVIDGVEVGYLTPRMYFDCNPPSKLHWTYLLFIKHLNPDNDKTPVEHPERYAHFKINPEDNAENLTEGYIDTLKGLSLRLRKRFLAGEFADGVANALFTDEMIDKWRENDLNKLPKMVRIAIGVDPSGSDDADNADNDEIGIVAAGLGIDGNAYILRDHTIKAGPGVWGKVATRLYDDLQANIIVAEVNFGGAMVKQTIQVARPGTPFLAVTASRGKHIRAEPFSALYEAGKVRHAGNFPELENELTNFTTVGFVGSKSPNRADAAIWALTALFPGLTKPKEDNSQIQVIPTVSMFNRKK